MGTLRDSASYKDKPKFLAPVSGATLPAQRAFARPYSKVAPVETPAGSAPLKSWPGHSFAKISVFPAAVQQKPLTERVTGPTTGAIQLQPEISATEKALGESLVAGLNSVEGSPKGHDKGVHYPHNYEAAAEEGRTNHDYEPYTDFWKDDYRAGYADPNYWTRTERMRWRLKPGKSAAAAIKAWLAGLTIAECYTTLIALETDTLRKAIGDANFDFRYGTLPTSDGGNPLKIGLPDEGGSVTSSVKEDQVLGLSDRAEGANREHWAGREHSPESKGRPGDRPLKKGEWVYFFNHPKYLLKHPGGAFQGENALYMGRNHSNEQIFSGFGVNQVTEGEMLQIMVDAYDNDRTEADYRAIVELVPRDSGGGDWRERYERIKDHVADEYREDKNLYPEKINDVRTLLEAPSATVDKTTRKGGLVPYSGTILKPDLVKTSLKNLTKWRLEAPTYGTMSTSQLVKAAIDVEDVAITGPKAKIKETIAANIGNALKQVLAGEYKNDVPGAISLYNSLRNLRLPRVVRKQMEASLRAVLDRVEARVLVTLQSDFRWLNDNIVIEISGGRGPKLSPPSKMGKSGDIHQLVVPLSDLLDFDARPIMHNLNIRVIDRGLLDSERTAVILDPRSRHARKWDATADQPYIVTVLLAQSRT